MLGLRGHHLGIVIERLFGDALGQLVAQAHDLLAKLVDDFGVV